MTQPLIACCDVGGTKVLVGLVTRAGDILASERFVIGNRTMPDQIVSDIGAALNRLLANTRTPRHALLGFGCSTTGVIDINTGMIFINQNLDWPLDIPFRDMLSEAVRLPVAIEMDANAAALGEAWLGGGRGRKTFVYVIVGTGIGAGIIIDGRIVHGAHSSAGEIGHTVILPKGPLCNCGKHGCLEALSAGVAIARQANAALKLERPSLLRDYPQPVTAEMVAQAARDGDTLAREVLDEAAYYLGIGLANIVTLLDPEAIVLGGGVALGAFDLLEPMMLRGFQQNLNHWSARNAQITLGTLGEYAGLLGGARAAFDRLSVDSNHIIQEKNA